MGWPAAWINVPGGPDKICYVYPASAPIAVDRIQVRAVGDKQLIRQPGRASQACTSFA